MRPGSTDMTFADIAWEGKPFRPPPYYGYRAIYWPSDRYGVMLDFTHIKAVAIRLQGWQSRAAAGAGLGHAQAA